LTPSRRAFLGGAGALILPLLAPLATRAAGSAATLSVKALGATGDGRTRDTQPVQATIDAAARSGGIVHFPPGEYLCGTLRLRSRVTLQLDADATIVASGEDEDFDRPEELPYDPFADRETADFRFALLQGRDLDAVAIVGPGRIDANRTRRGGPKVIALRECRNVTIRGLTIGNAANYNISLLGCERVDIVGVTILNGYSDGIDPDCCRRVRIANCRIESRDDAIAIKTSFSLGYRSATRDVSVTGCHLTTIHNALKVGTESTGDFRNIEFRNCTVVGRTHAWAGDLSSGVSLESADGGNLEDVRVSDIRMVNVRTPIFIRLGERGRAQPRPETGTLRNVSLWSVTASGAMMASSITGVRGHPVSDVHMKDVRISGRGGGKARIAPQDVPEFERRYPDAYMFKDLPAWGLYVRHAANLRIERLDLSLELPDQRAAVMLDDVGGATLRAIQAAPSEGDAPMLWLRSVRDGLVQDPRPGAGTRTLVRLSGPDSARIRLAGVDPRRVETVVVRDADVTATALATVAP